MLSNAKKIGAVLLTALALLAVTAEPVQAQRRFRSAQDYYPVNRNPYVVPGVTLKQWQYNTRVVGRTLQQAYPLNYAYNPYAQAALFSSRTPAYNAYYNPPYPVYNNTPYLNYSNPYNLSSNPYNLSNNLYSGSYNPGYNATYGSGYGGYPN